MSLLRSAIRTSAVIRLPGTTGEDYPFAILPFGERGTRIDPRLSAEIVNRLCEAVTGQWAAVDLIVAPEPGGHVWALSVAMRLGIELAVLRTTPAAEPATKLTVESGYAKRTFWLPNTAEGSRVLVLDDVVSTGNTLRSIVQGLRASGASVVGILAIFSRSNQHDGLQAELDVPVFVLETGEVAEQGPSSVGL